MAEADQPKSEIAEEETENPSVQILRESHVVPDMRQRDVLPDRHPLDSELKIEIAPMAQPAAASIETVYENAVLDHSVSSETASTNNTVDSTSEINSTKLTGMSGRLNKMRGQCSSVFPIGTMGCKQMDELPCPRRFLDAGEASYDTIGHIENMPRKMNLRNNQGRNPLLGTGLDQDDNNPNNTDNLGVSRGNSDLRQDCTGNAQRSSTARIPPGGYSQGLW